MKGGLKKMSKREEEVVRVGQHLGMVEVAMQSRRYQ